MKSTLLIALLALASPVYAQTTQVISTPISTVPVVITKPGHYYFVANLFFTLPTPTSPSTAITVNAPGLVVIDMRGFTLNGQTRYVFPSDGYFQVFPNAILIQSSNVLVLNGEIKGFWNGVYASGSSAAYLTGIDIENVEFFGSGNDGSVFDHVNGSLVRNCRYIENYAGMYDGITQTGNRYINDTSQYSENPQWAFGVAATVDDKIVYNYTATPCKPAPIQ